MKWIPLMAVIAGVIGLGIAKGLLQKWAPVPAPRAGERSKEELLQIFADRRNAAQWVFLLWTGIVGVATWRLFLRLADSFGPEAPGADCVLTFPPVAWFFPALFLVGPAMGQLLNFVSFSILLGAEHPDFIRSYELESGYDSSWDRIFTVAFLVLIVPTLVWLMLDSYIYVTRDEILINRFSSTREERVTYSEVTKIELAEGRSRRVGNRSESSLQVVIHFEDDRTWDSQWIAGDGNYGQLRRLTRLISQRSGVPVQQVRDL